MMTNKFLNRIRVISRTSTFSNDMEISSLGDGSSIRVDVGATRSESGNSLGGCVISAVINL